METFRDSLSGHHPVAIPDAQGEQEKQVSVLLDAREVKIVSIRLRHGVSLPEHTSPFPVIIQAPSGSGTVVFGQERAHIDAQHFVCLPPNAPHSVVPDGSADLLLLVHHLRNGDRL